MESSLLCSSLLGHIFFEAGADIGTGRFCFWQDFFSDCNSSINIFNFLTWPGGKRQFRVDDECMYFISMGKVSAMKDSISCKLSSSILEITDIVSYPAATKQLKELGHHINSMCTIYITIQVTAPTIL